MLRPWELQIQVKLQDSKAVYLQIADAIITAIKQGVLKPKDVLPGSRKLAEQIGVNRNTVVKAMDVLIIEGWLQTAERKGVFVADVLTNTKKNESRSALQVIKPMKPHIPKAKICFDDGLPDSRLAPITELARAYRQLFDRKAKWQMMGYSEAQGDPVFREVIVTMLNHKRGLALNSKELCVTRGSQMALFLIAHCLIEKGDTVLIENPGYKPAWDAFKNAGAELLPVPMETDGMKLETVKSYLATGRKIKAIYTTPHHHFPTTVSLSLSKRLELIQLSNKHGFYIVEDDYDHEFHFGARPLLPVGSLQDIEQYVYIGTLSKIIFPALRIGYIASNESLIEKVVALRSIIDVQGDNIMEQAILQLIQDGSIRKHLNRATPYYQKKRDRFAIIVEELLGEKVQFTKPEGGLAFWLVPKHSADITEIAHQALHRGVQLLMPEKYSFGTPIQGMRLGYASLTEQQLEEGISVLGDLLH